MEDPSEDLSSSDSESSTEAKVEQYFSKRTRRTIPDLEPRFYESESDSDSSNTTVSQPPTHQKRRRNETVDSDDFSIKSTESTNIYEESSYSGHSSEEESLDSDYEHEEVPDIILRCDPLDQSELPTPPTRLQQTLLAAKPKIASNNPYLIPLQ